MKSKIHTRRAVTAVLLENQEKFLREQSAFESGTSMLTETPNMNTNSSASAAGFSGSSGWRSCCRFRSRSDLTDQTLHA